MNPLSSILSIANKVLDRVIPDKNARAEAKEELLKVAQSNEFDALLGQMEVNKIEAGHKSIFVAGARPATLWVCTAAMLALVIASIVAVFMDLDITPFHLVYGSTVGPVHLGLLGLRTYEKARGVAFHSLNAKGGTK